MISDDVRARVLLAHDRYMLARDEWERASEQRNATLKEAIEQGASQSELSRLLGISLAQVQRCIGKRGRHTPK